MGDVITRIRSPGRGWRACSSCFLLIAQFIAYFNFRRCPNVAAVKLATCSRRWTSRDLAADRIRPRHADRRPDHPEAIAKWALFAPIFIPLFERLDVAPQTVLAAYRVGDSPMNVVTPLMAYFPLIVIFVQRYRKDAGIGTVVSLMLPYVFILTVLWTLFFVAWYLFGIPLGPGAPVKL